MGALIAQMIRENTDESILCVCYTNHALDQFLEHLYDNGETRIVRIGGRSQSEKLQKYNLKELARSKTKLSRDAKQRMSSVFAQLCKCQERLDQLSEKLKQKIHLCIRHQKMTFYLLYRIHAVLVCVLFE